MDRREVAIVGYACRVPGASSSKALWSLLRDNRCSVGTITQDRFPTGAFFHPDRDQAGRSYSFAAGVIDDVWGFDASAFGMSPREAEQVDPQQRHLLEVTHDALAHAGIPASSLGGSDAAVYVGASSADHATQFFIDPSAADVHMMTGNSLSIIANRISYTLDLRGPSIAIDTACSSSMVALDLAAEAIRNGTIDTALVGGVNLVLSPFSYVGFSRASMLSPTGLCRPFDAAADGYVRAEGAIAVVLRSMSAAHKARNRIHAVIVGSGVNQDGRTTGLSLPSAASQRELLSRVYAKFGVDPRDLSFVEAHGTGTQVGDPIEADALGNGLGRARSRPLPIGSIKSNIGHLEPVSGLAGIVKSILSLEHGMLPATLHQQAPSPNIPFDDLNLEVVGRNRPLPERRGPELVGVNSFGFGGTNAHTILRSERTTASFIQVASERPLPPLLLSAHSADALPQLAAAHLDMWPQDHRRARDFVAAAAYQRDTLAHRLIVRSGSADEVRHRLGQVAKGNVPAGVLSDQAHGNGLPVAFLFSGNGSQWAGMGRDAWETNAVFRDALIEIDGHFAKRQKWSIVDALFSDDLASRLRSATYSQPLLLALQMATVRTLEEGGLVPSMALGHSVGEIAAAWCAGILGLPQAIDIVLARSRHQEIVRGSGGMAALMLSDREARRFLKSVGTSSVEIAAINSWRSVTVSGPVVEIDGLLDAAATLRISARRLDLDYPFHSALVDPVCGPLQRELEGLQAMAPRRQFVSSVTGQAPDSLDDFGAEYWWRNVREPVRFEAALGTALQQGVRIFVEVGPRPVLASYARDVMREAGVRGAIVDTLTETDGSSPSDPFERCIARAFLAGGQIETARFFGPEPPGTIDLPLYPWQHTQYKVRHTDEASTVMSQPAHAMLGQATRSGGSEWYSTIDPALYPWIADHKVGGAIVFPATAYVEVMLAAARECHGDNALELRDFDILRPIVFEGPASFETRVSISRETGVAEYMSRPRGSGSEWTLNARGIVARSPVTAKAAFVPDIAKAGVIVPRSRVYACARELGFDYGSSFQRAREVFFPEPKLGVSPLEPLRSLVAGTQLLDVTGLDSAFHALFASEEAGVADMPMKRMLPVRFGSVRVFRPGAVATQIVARTLRQSPTSLVLNIDLWDERGDIVVSAQQVRLVEAPAELIDEPRFLSYRMMPWQLDADGSPAAASLASSPSLPVPDATDSADLSEGLMLVEAGSLRTCWSALARQAADAPNEVRAGTTASEGFLRAALLLHLEGRNLVVERAGVRTISGSCELPDIGSIANSLLVRHPRMALEAASLSRLEDVVAGLLGGDEEAAAELSASHWRLLGSTAAQVIALREAAVADISARLSRVEPERLVRLLMIGADHTSVAMDLCSGFPNLEILLTDQDESRLEQAKAKLADEMPQIRPVAWSQLDSLPSHSKDLLLALDSLSEVAATPDGLPRISKLLRPGAPMIAAEPAPSIFWDIVRGTRPGWWARSSSREFPVGALLTGQEWIDQLGSEGFSSVTAHPIADEPRIGVLIRCIAATQQIATDARVEPARFRWEGSGALELRRVFDHQSGGESASPERAPTDVVLAFAAGDIVEDPIGELASFLEIIADRCRSIGEDTSRQWVVVDFGDSEFPPLEQPLWCALSSALRVMQNEYAGLDVRCIGISGPQRSAALEQTAAELRAPGAEHELFFQGTGRIVFRVERGAVPPAPPHPVPEDRILRLTTRNGTTRGVLAWSEEQRAAPGPNEVEIEVAATGLNFRDVMWNLRLLPEEALEDGYAGPGLGMECAGIVTRLGAGVTTLSPGDRVLSFVPRAFSTHVVAPAFAVSRLPDKLSLESATTLPVAFLTAYYSLVHLARLQHGEVVLIHGGAGAVGLAALQIAKHMGARVIASAGSEEKRALLLHAGADYVCNSRTLAFEEQVASFTSGKGVDVVLNSLAGEAMTRSLECLKPFGRFVELGKRDFYANTHLGLRPMRRNISYFGVDVDQLISGQRSLAERLFAEIVELFAADALTPLPYRVFDGNHVADAFRLMQRSGHIGKIVVRPPARSQISQAGHFPVDPEGIHIVIGGVGGFGLAAARWLADRGARHLVLASRSGRLGEEAALDVATLESSGVSVRVATVDVADFASLRRMLLDIGQTGRIKGIVNAAMILDDRLIQGMDSAAIESVLRPKAAAALHLERLGSDLALDYLLLFSSATTLFGNPGQFNYVAANGFVEGVARRMRSSGQPALAVAWGAIEDTGYLARHMSTNANLRKRFATTLMTSRAALDALDWAFDGAGRPKTAACAIARIDWSVAKRELAAVRTPTFSAIETAAAGRQGSHVAQTIERLRGMPVEEAATILLDIVVEEIAQVLRLPPKEVDRHRPLADIGMDSLMMLELRNTVEMALQVDLPMMSLASGITPAEVARRIAPLVTGDAKAPNVPGHIVALSASHFAEEAESVPHATAEAAVAAVLERARQIDGPT